ncbi:MAG TPA: ABC transporter substrate-binding protein [Polyangia bacterium]
MTFRPIPDHAHSFQPSGRGLTVGRCLGIALAVVAATFAIAPPSVHAAESPAAEASSPRAALEQANAKLKKQFGPRKPSWSPEAQARNADIQKIVGSFLDFEEIAKRSLAKHWDALTPKQRTEFVKTLRELIERNYLRQLYGQPDYNLKLEQEQVTGSDATVNGTLLAKAKGKKVTMALEYKMVRKNNRWVVYDIITDDLSLLENYRAEFNKVIQKESFEALLGKMKKKLAEKA